MSPYLFLIPVFFPMLSGILFRLLRLKRYALRVLFCMITVCLTSAAVCLLLYRYTGGAAQLIRFTQNHTMTIQPDGAGKLFACMLAVFWPPATLYALSYLKDDERVHTFFLFFLATFGAALGIAFAGNLLTLYFFFELLTLLTLPLVMHTMTKHAVHAARKYLYMSLGGTAFAFIGLVFTLVYGTSASFASGGVFTPETIANNGTLLRIVFLFTFLGFGVKAAVFPLHSWLPDASVAPTPVTALLHAVAVVNTGVFAVSRVVYDVFGTALIAGSRVYAAVLAIVLFTMLYGSVMAVRERQLKRRLAYSTIGNLAYMLAAVLMLSVGGLRAAYLHMFFHGGIKIVLFYCAGAMIRKADCVDIDHTAGIARRMPLTAACFSIAAVALVGVPPLAGFLSKFQILQASAVQGGAAGFATLAVLLLSAFLTAFYCFPIVGRIYFPSANTPLCEKGRDPELGMLLPILLFTAAVVFFGIWPQPILTALSVCLPG